MRDDELYEYLNTVFEWSRMKAAKNLIDHNVSFPEAATSFTDTNALSIPDEDHSEDEQRYNVIGMSVRARELIVSHVFRSDRIRLISARRPTPRERKDYEARLGRSIRNESGI